MTMDKTVLKIRNYPMVITIEKMVQLWNDQMVIKSSLYLISTKRNCLEKKDEI
jgi:hypothetical protein